MKFRLTKDRVLGTLLALLTAMIVAPAHADGRQPLKILFAGGFVQNITQDQVFMGIPTGTTEPRSIALTKGVGSLGRVDIMAVTRGGLPVSTETCPAGLVKIADITDNNLVLTFADLSLLYGDGTGVVCLDPLNPTAPPIAEINGTWLGGTGRFEGAGGEWSIRFGDFVQISPTTQFNAENGVITGFLTRD